MTRITALFAALFILSTTTACSNFLTKLAAGSTVNVLKKGTVSFERETDLWLARTAATANLKMFEGVLEATPEHEDLMVMIAKSYSLYAFAFLEWELEQLEPFTDEFEAVKARAVEFNLRARRYAIRRMVMDFEDFETAALGGGERLWAILAECDEDHIGAVYFLALSWGALINLQNDDPEWLADLSRVKRIMEWVRAKAPGYMHAGPHMFYGMINMALPKQLGGQPEEAKKGFDAAISYSKRRYLMPIALYARKYMVATNNRLGFERLLNEVIDADPQIYPAQNLSNAVAKQRAKKWLSEVDELFDSEDDDDSAEPKLVPAEPKLVPTEPKLVPVKKEETPKSDVPAPANENKEPSAETDAQPKEETP